MNWLAHILLSEPREECMLGNLLGDFVKLNKVEDALPTDVVYGIKCHIKIDAFTDTHPLFLQSRRRFSPEYARFAGVLVDIFYDHLLAVNWDIYCDKSLNSFVQRFYKILKKYEHILPPNLLAISDYIIADNWFCSYADIEGIRLALRRISNRLSIKNNLPGAVDELLEYFEGFESDFHAFFPQVMEYASTLSTVIDM